MHLRNFILPTLAVLSLSACMGSTSDDSGLTAPELEDNGVATISAGDAIATLPYIYEIDHKRSVDEEATYTAKKLPKWATVDKRTGYISGTPSKDDISAYQEIEIELTTETTRQLLETHIAVRHVETLSDDTRIDFYDRPFDNKPRSYRNDLIGNLAGEVQFVQTHSVAPKHEDNLRIIEEDQKKSQYKPDLVALRDTLLLFMPEAGTEPITMHIEVNAPGESALTLAMQPPQALYQADRLTEISYSKKAWFVELPWQYMRNGLAINFIMDKDNPEHKTGLLSSDKIDIDRATEIVFNTVRLGMLTEPPEPNNNHFTLSDPILAATDYFQTLPVSKMVMASYNDIELTRTIVNQNGKARVYDKTIDIGSDTEGDVYSGDMRENVGKAQVSTGINLANTGITSWDVAQNYPKAQKIITSHHAVGMYKCEGEKNCPVSGFWRVGHGLSGGNGIGTIFASAGNEASHEWGHAYGLGHWPGSDLTKDCRWADHHADSGWGYITHRKRMRNSVYRIAQADGESRNICSQLERPLLHNKGEFMYARDAMSGGNNGTSAFSRYTFYTGFSARLIQKDLNNWYIPAVESESGYKQWDVEAGDFVDVNGPTVDGKPAPLPTHIGVPVATILGGYDPVDSHYTDNEDRAVIYPVFHGNYGNIFDLAAPNLNDGEDHCWVEVNNAKGQKKLVEVLNERNNGGSVNQIHFNLHADFKPTKASLYCRRDGNDKLLTETKFDGVIPKLPPVAIVGQEHGIKQLQAREMQEIEQAVNGGDIFSLSHDINIKIDSYSDEQLQHGLTQGAWEKVSELRHANNSLAAVPAVLNYAKALGLSTEEIKQRLSDYLYETQLISSDEELNLIGSPIYARATASAQPKTAYVSTDFVENKIWARTDIKNADQHLWFIDSQSKIHLAAQPELCLVASNPLSVQRCDNNSTSHRWVYDEKSSDYPRLIASNGNCVDINNGQVPNFLGLYGCGGNKWNQAFSDIQRNNAKWLSLADAKTIELIQQVLGQ